MLLLFQSPPIHLINEGGIPTLGLLEWPTKVTWHRAVYVTYTHSLGEKDSTCSTGPHGSFIQEQSEKVSLWESAFVVSRGWGDPWFLQEDVIGLVE